MNAATGFTLILQGTEEQRSRAAAARQRALAHFTDMKTRCITLGDTTLELWGRDVVVDGSENECIHRLPDGSLLALVGSPVGEFTWETIDAALTAGSYLSDFCLPWDGRVLLLYVSADGRCWKVWNDWLGSIPVFTTPAQKNRMASTLEPVVVAANEFTENDFFLPALLFLLMQGHYLSNWTLYKDMQTIRPDSVTTWDDQGFRAVCCGTIQATDKHFESGWDDLIEEMHALVETSIRSTLKTQPAWIVPLSSGLDSRLIAAVGAAAGSSIRTYTWGPPTTRDVVFSHQISKALGLPWQRIDLGDDYLARYLPLWVNLFGSAMHFHGMYQIPFLEALKETPPARILSGYVGECLAGYDVHFQTEMHQSGARHYFTHPSGYLHWTTEDLKRLFRFPIDEALEQIADTIEVEKNAVSGPVFQKLRYLTLWSRQNHFTYFQSMLADYWRGVANPYLNLDYARFCFSLPRAVLDDRRLQIEMMRRYYPRVMNIAGTYAPEPAILTGSYLLKKRAARVLPPAWTSRLLPEFAATKNIRTDVSSMQACGEKATWPIPQTTALLSQWFNMEEIEKEFQSAVAGSMRSVRRIQSVQPIAYRLMNQHTEKPDEI